MKCLVAGPLLSSILAYVCLQSFASGGTHGLLLVHGMFFLSSFCDWLPFSG